MKISIAAKLRPFSHRPGAMCVIPLTSIQVQAFPTLLRFVDLISGESWEEKMDWKGPIEEFTLQLDLEKNCVAVFGKTKEGFRRVWIEAAEKEIRLIFDRENKQKSFKAKVIPQPASVEKLSLGKHTQLDWSLVSERMDIQEMTPVLFSLGQLVPEAQAVSPIVDLLRFPEKQTVVKQLDSFFRAGFQGILSPRLKDEFFQGLVREGAVSGSPIALLRQGYQAIRGLFFEEQEKIFNLLPTLPPEFHAGRLLHLQTAQGDLVSLEWSKKLLKRVIIKPGKSREIFLELQKSLCTYRLNRKQKYEVKKPLLLEAGRTLFLDRFEK